MFIMLNNNQLEPCCQLASIPGPIHLTLLSNYSNCLLCLELHVGWCEQSFAAVVDVLAAHRSQCNWWDLLHCWGIQPRFHFCCLAMHYDVTSCSSYLMSCSRNLLLSPYSLYNAQVLSLTAVFSGFLAWFAWRTWYWMEADGEVIWSNGVEHSINQPKWTVFMHESTTLGDLPLLDYGYSALAADSIALWN